MNSHRKLSILAGALLLGGLLPAGAQTVSLDSCRHLAMRNNKAISVADAAEKAASYRRQAARAAYLPGIDFSGLYNLSNRQIELLGEDAKLPTMKFDPATGSYQYNLVTGADGVPVKDPATGSYIPAEVAVIPKDAMSYNTHQVFAGAFTLTQPVFMGGEIRALNLMAKYGEELAKTVRNSTVQEVIYSTDEAYWTVVSLKAKKRLAESFVALVDTLHYNVEMMLREGVATRSDLLTVDVRLNEARVALTKVDNGLALSRMALAQLCGLPIDTQMCLEDEDLERTPKDAPQLPTCDMQEVYERRQDLASMRHGISIFESKEKLALGAMLPKLALVGAYSFSNPNVNNGFHRSFGGGFSIGATLTVPLWHWGGNYNNYRAARAETAAQRLLLDDLEQKVDLQVNQARFKYSEAYKTYSMTCSNMAKANENLRQAQLGFREGVLTTSDVITAQTAWLQANSEKIDAEIGVQLCNVYLSKVLGTLPY